MHLLKKHLFRINRHAKFNLSHQKQKKENKKVLTENCESVILRVAFYKLYENSTQL